MGDEQTHPAGDGGAWGTWVGRIEQLEAENQRLRAEVERRDDRLLSMGVRIQRLEDLVRQLAPHCKGATLNDDHVATARSVPQAHLGGKVELHLLKPVGQADCLCEHTYPADAVALIADACKHDERVRAQVGLLIEPPVDAVSIVADVWSRLPIEAAADGAR